MAVNKSRLLVKALRHDPVSILGVELDSNGYVGISVVLSKLEISYDELENMYMSNNKKRFEFNEDRTKIRAAQGHSVKGVDLGLEPIIPPSKLYHGTNIKASKLIMQSGISKMKRHAVHLTEDVSLAISQGERWKNSTSVILEINSGQMHSDGYKFTKSTNDVWLVDFVPSKYITKK